MLKKKSGRFYMFCCVRGGCGGMQARCKTGGEKTQHPPTQIRDDSTKMRC